MCLLRSANKRSIDCHLIEASRVKANSRDSIIVSGERDIVSTAPLKSGRPRFVLDPEIPSSSTQVALCTPLTRLIGCTPSHPKPVKSAISFLSRQMRRHRCQTFFFFFFSFFSVRLFATRLQLLRCKACLIIGHS
ncbi:hypothetical protein TNCV_1782211 [Trichonephila clavipes]|nr:hypothetical protein TNCV_1782211 [Trichonephila clavipes]